jgi:hypothetical protein
MHPMAESIAPKQIASQLGISPKALRRFMRTMADKQTTAGKDARVARVGQGNRYDLSKADAAFIIAAWRKAHAAPKPSAAQIEAVAHDAIMPPVDES